MNCPNRVKLPASFHYCSAQTRSWEVAVLEIVRFQKKKRYATEITAVNLGTNPVAARAGIAGSRCFLERISASTTPLH
jgi:hypothetical protein